MLLTLFHFQLYGAKWKALHFGANIANKNILSLTEVPMFRNRVFVLFTVVLLAFLTIGSASAESVSVTPTPPLPEMTAWTISGNAGGQGGVTLSFYIGGFLNTVTSAGDGSYSLNVPDGWTGIVTPSKPGYAFSPTNHNYASTPVTADVTGQDFSVLVLTATPTLSPTPTSLVTLTPTRTKTPIPGLTPTKTPTPTSPSGFSKLYPWDHAANINPQSVTFSWRSYAGAQKYRICLDLSNNNACDAPGGYLSVSGTTYTLPVSLLINTTYVWHVQAVICSTCTPKTVVDSNGGTWWAFTTGGAPTATPTKTPLPSTVTYTSVGAQDGWILESTKNSGIGGSMSVGSANLQLGDDALNRQYRVILSFNTAPLP
ncbi:MAG: hypothetical protein WA821_11300, partial [Anaerolineales bacterium]